MKINDIIAASGCALIPAAVLGFSYFVPRWGWKGCIAATFLSFFIAILILAAYIWQSQRKEGRQ